MFVPVTDADQAVALYRAGLLWETWPGSDGYLPAAGWSVPAIEWYVRNAERRTPGLIRLFVNLED